MKFMRRTAKLCALTILFACAGGCGKDSGNGRREEAFKVPDSLLAPRQGYRLTVDEYHPVMGGLMVNEQIELHFPASQIASYVGTRIFGEALAAYGLATDLIARPSPGRVIVIGAKDMEEYSFLTRKQWWYYAVIEGDTIICQPFDIMMKRFDPITRRSISEIGLTQKMAQMALDRVSAGALPIWLREAVASHIADERPVLRAQIEQFRGRLAGHSPGLDELEQTLHIAQDIMLTRAAFFFSYRMLERLLERTTLEEVIGFARRLGEGEPLDDASVAVFGMRYLDLVESIRPNDLYDGAGEVDRPLQDEKLRHGNE